MRLHLWPEGPGDQNNTRDEQHSGEKIMYFTQWSRQYFQYPPGTIHSCYNMIGYIPYAALSSPVTVPQLPICTPLSLHLFHPAPKRPPLWQLSLCSLYPSLFVLSGNHNLKVKSKNKLKKERSWNNKYSFPMGN